MDTRNDVLDFMRACEQTRNDWPQAQLYMRLVIEEYTELCNAFEAKDMVEIADACADLKWVIEGLEHSLGIPNQAVWDEVNRSNRSKFVNGKLTKHPITGKVLKPDTYSPPNIKTILKDRFDVDA
jgi:predicted HAD superfamily Cof-like phosphohydrolase